MHILQIITTWLILDVIYDGIHCFGYSKKEQLWSQKYKSGKRQSPVAITKSNVVASTFPELKMYGYHDFLQMPQTLTNDGRTVELIMNKNAVRPCIDGANLQNPYVAEQFHFHWGLENHRGSEHALNDKRYPMEMHIVHRNMKYLNFSQALEHKDGVAVVASFFELQHGDNKRLKSFFSKVPYVQLPHTELLVNISITLACLIPSDTDVFYTYQGSLTTPPYNEVVTWIIFDKPVPISYHQINMFRQLSNGTGPLGDNYRQLQKLGQRKIYTRKFNESVSTKDTKRDDF